MRRRARRRAAILAGTALFVAQTAACYTYVPRYGMQPSSGEPVALTITDQGRVALAEQVGAGVTRIAGRVVAAQDDSYVLSVDQIETIGSGTSHWTGERVSIRRDYVAGVQERRFSKGRTALAIGAAILGVGALILTASLTGFGFDGGDRGSGNPPNGT